VAEGAVPLHALAPAHPCTDRFLGSNPEKKKKIFKFGGRAIASWPVALEAPKFPFLSLSPSSWALLVDPPLLLHPLPFQTMPQLHLCVIVSALQMRLFLAASNMPTQFNQGYSYTP